MAKLQQVDGYGIDRGMAYFELQAHHLEEEKLQANLLERMNRVADAIVETGSIVRLSDFRFAMHGVSKKDREGNPLHYGRIRNQFSDRHIGDVFAGYTPGGSSFDGPRLYWMFNRRNFDRRLSEPRDENDWYATRYAIRKEYGAYIGSVIVPALFVERNHQLGEIGTLGQIGESEFVCRTVRREVGETVTDAPQDTTVVWRNDIADYRKSHHPGRYAEALQQIAEAETMLR